MVDYIQELILITRSLGDDGSREMLPGQVIRREVGESVSFILSVVISSKPAVSEDTGVRRLPLNP